MHGLKQALLQIWRLTVPYYTTRDMTEIRLWPLPAVRLQERWVALTMAALVIGIEFAQVAINVRLSYFNRDWFNAIQSKDAAAFWSLLFSVFCLWASIYVASAIIQYVIQSYLRIRWRSWMTRHYVDRWLGRDTHYRMGLTGLQADNPDQRIADDVDQFTQTTQTLAISLLSAVSNLVSFSVILWSISAAFTVPGTDWHVPGFLVWGALIYSAFVTWLTHRIGRPLIRLNFEQQRREADFRFSLARLREYGEQVALLSGGGAERGLLRDRFAALIANFYAIVDRRKKLSAFTVSYQQLNVVIPYVLVAPYYFSGQIALGQMTQTAGAFARVEGTMSFFITAYVTLADYKAQVDRLVTFDASMERAEALTAASRLHVGREAGEVLRIAGLGLDLPDGRRIAAVPDLVLRAGETTLLAGPSGSGKSTLFRALAGIWPFGEGEVTLPADARVMLLPQRPYLPQGSLRAAATYPDASGRHDDAAIREALGAAQLPHLTERLDEVAPWAQSLSLGEQQRLAIARALLERPDWLFLDEATAALDEPTEAALYRTLRQRLPDTTLVSIGHRSTLDAFHQRRIDMRRREDGVFAPVDTREAVPAQ
ncbi:ABC transporter ATP-binding protein/permease [uncultured Methylobacterium sp.]|jgi:putative ATP-binding cassette transporter|uniref:ABC transporter ATP-binding protein/permease n=1 Tax=uncultured Methylobacterium sp. TaxID=157278 RepID=UPI0026220C51|nr:ABC transporter ATP-binding protein/permease [uncultured Methylobacterium sp.]